MSTATEVNYAELVGKQAAMPLAQSTPNFAQRLNHWYNAMEAQKEAFRVEDAKLQQAGGSIALTFDLTKVRELRDESLTVGTLSHQIFDPSGDRRMVKIGELSLSSHQVPNKWAFYTGLRMSKNPDRNPALFARLEPTAIDLGPEVRLPSLTLLPDTILFTYDWFLLEGTAQDFTNVAILNAYDFGSRPSVKNVAQGAIAVLLSGAKF